MSIYSSTRRVSILIILSLFSAVACAGIVAKPYNEKISPVLKYYSIQNFKKALHNADNLVKENKNKTDFYLSLLERGKVALANGDYDKAIEDLQRAERRFLRIEGTVSINEDFGSFFSNDLNKEYETDPHETLLISPYLAIAYLLKGDFNGAKVERNRTINKISEYIRNSGKKHLENPFARYLSAIIYEMEGKYQDAEIEYKLIKKNTPSLSIIKGNKKPSTDIVVFIDAGLSPYKYEVIFGPVPIMIAKTKAIIRFAYPKMKKTPSITDSCQVFLDSKTSVETSLLYNLEHTVMEQFRTTSSKREKAIFNRVVSKVALSMSAQAAGEAIGGEGGAALSALSLLFNISTSYMEKADLRQWKTLPKNINYMRVNDIKAGKRDIVIQCGSSYNVIKNFDIKEKQINILYSAFPK